jgi:hypothetical protein
MKIVSVMTVLACFFASIAFAEPAADTFIGKVEVRNETKLDSQAKKELAAIAVKIKKTLKSGTVKLVGDVPSAGSPDDYLTKSFLLAKVVETQLRSLLPASYQIFLTASRYNGDQSSEKNDVSVFLYPYELKAEGLRFISSQLKSQLRVEKSVGDAAAVQSTQDEPVPVGSVLPADSALSAPLHPDIDRRNLKSKKEREIVESEDVRKANDLVNKAKARAAERAKRRESQD